MKTQGLDDAFNVESSIVSTDKNDVVKKPERLTNCLLYTSPSPRD